MLKRNQTPLLCTIAILGQFLINPSAAQAVTVFQESMDGDLSNDTANPTPLGTLALGESEVIGTLTNVTVDDPDVFNFTIAPGSSLSEIRVNNIEGPNHFIGFDLGNFAVNNDASQLLIASLIGSANNGENLLSTLSGGGDFEGSGLTAPLGPGDYTFWFQETANGTNFDYSFSLVTVPEPTTGLLALLGSLLFLRRKR